MSSVLLVTSWLFNLTVRCFSSVTKSSANTGSRQTPAMKPGWPKVAKPHWNDKQRETTRRASGHSKLILGKSSSCRLQTVRDELLPWFLYSLALQRPRPVGSLETSKSPGDFAGDHKKNSMAHRFSIALKTSNHRVNVKNDFDACALS